MLKIDDGIENNLESIATITRAKQIFDAIIISDIFVDYTPKCKPNFISYFSFLLDPKGLRSSSNSKEL